MSDFDSEKNYYIVHSFFNNHSGKNLANETNDSLYDEKIYYLNMLAFRKLDIQPSPFQRSHNENHIHYLADSIEQSNKIHHNFIVFNYNRTYTIADGIHRYEALTYIPEKKLKTIFALVKVYEFKKANEQNVRSTFDEINNILPLDKQLQIDSNKYTDFLRQHFNDNCSTKGKQVIKTINVESSDKISSKKNYEIDSYSLKVMIEKHLQTIQQYSCEEFYNILKEFNDTKIKTNEFETYKGKHGKFSYDLIKERIRKTKQFCLGLYFPEVFETLFPI